MSPVLVRLLLAMGIALLGLGIFLAVNRWILRRGAKKILGLEEFRLGRPAVLYFTMEDCIPCKTAQRPALNKLAEMTEEKVQIIQVDVMERPDLAESWGVLSVPTTFIIDPDGQPRRVNHGVAMAEKLLEQLEAVTGNLQSVDKSRSRVEASASISGD